MSQVVAEKHIALQASGVKQPPTKPIQQLCNIGQNLNLLKHGFVICQVNMTAFFGKKIKKEMETFNEVRFTCSLLRFIAGWKLEPKSLNFYCRNVFCCSSFSHLPLPECLPNSQSLLLCTVKASCSGEILKCLIFKHLLSN